MAKLNGQHPDKRVGPSLVLRVMAGDTISIGAKAFYKSIGSKQDKSPVPVADMAASLIRAFGSGQPGSNGKEVATEGAGRAPFNDQFINDGYQRMKEKEPADPAQENRPKAYLNFALFDDRFNLVEDNSGVKQVKAEPDQLQTLAQDRMVMKSSGYLYVYTSNETPQDVFFDNLTVLNSPGPMLEETHYYPFGLTMAGISAKAIGVIENKREKFQGQPQDDELGLNWYGFKWRNHDPQIGRFVQIDPLSEKYVHNSTYAFSENKVTAHVELEGLEAMPSPMIFGSNPPLVRIPFIEQVAKPAIEVGAKAAETAGKMPDHHIIPRAVRNNPLVRQARDGGFKFEGKENRIPLEQFSKSTGRGQHANHPKYNTEVSGRLARFSENNPSSTPEQAVQFLRGLVQELKEIIQSNPETKVNDLFKSISPVPTTPRDNTAPRPAPNTNDIDPRPKPIESHPMYT